MAVGKIEFPEAVEIDGIRLGAACAGIKRADKDDVVVIEMAEGGRSAAVFTRNAFQAAPVQLAREHLASSPRWLLINSGNANAGTGRQGLSDARATCLALAERVGADERQVLPFSTGVIGERLPAEKIMEALPPALASLSPLGWERAARAIMTTDTFPKGAVRRIRLHGRDVQLFGIAKGAGMIHPDMATMLAFVATDANIEQTCLEYALRQAVEETFNRISVDGDTSTNDACVLLATGRAHDGVIGLEGSEYLEFFGALKEVCGELAEAIVRDGEGATKLMRILVRGAASAEEAHRVGKTIAHSPLVKTAFFASDPNWGRILAAVGRAGIPDLDIQNVSIWLGDVCIVCDGERDEAYTEAAGQAVMSREDISVTVDLGRGDAQQWVLTCDFSYDYVRINAEYRT